MAGSYVPIQYSFFMVGKSAPGNQPPTAIKAGPKTTGSLLSQARTENNPVLERTNLPQSTSPKAGKCENSMAAW